MKIAIKPDVLNILCREPVPVQQAPPMYQHQQPVPAKRSFWSKAWGFLKTVAKVITFIVSTIVTLPPALNATSRFIKTLREGSSNGLVIA